MNCKRVQEWLLAYLDGEGSPSQRAEIEAHLARCPDCAAERDALVALQTELSATVHTVADGVHLPPAAEARILSRLNKRLEKRPLPGPLATWRLWLRSHSWALARALVILLVGALVAASLYVTQVAPGALPPPPEPDRQETLLLGQARFEPGSLAAVRVLVRQMPEQAPVAGAEVRISLAPEGEPDRAQVVFVGQTDASGTLPVSFRLPAGLEEGQYSLTLSTSSPVGSDELQQAVTVQRSYRLLLTTDKPVYQPGQPLHMRVLALGTMDLRPAAGQTVEFLVEDPQENKLLRKQVIASEYGIASLDFPLAEEAAHGRYRLTARLGDTASERVVTVEPYVLPKFGLQVETDRAYYQPGDRVQGSILAEYFFGKPVIQGRVELRGRAEPRSLTYDVAPSQEIAIQGETGDDGRFEFEFDLPSYLTGGTLEANVAHFGLEVSVTDQAGHTEQTAHLLPVSDQAILIQAVAEGGSLKPGLENVVYLMTSYPDGSPADTHLTASYGQETAELETGPYGLAELHLSPQTGSGDQWLFLTAADANGNQGSRSLEIRVDGGTDHLLLRPAQATYQVGETLAAEVLATQADGIVYLDVVKEGQTMLTQVAPLDQGRATFVLDLSPDLAGTLELHAYQVRPDGSIVRDTRLVVVDTGAALSLDVAAGQDVYRPGDTAELSFDVTGSDGTGTQAALGLGIVDESVYALQEQDPGFAKLYFLLEKTLMEPRYQIKDLVLPTTTESPPAGTARQAQDTSAAAALAGAADLGFEVQASSYPAKAQAAQQARQEWERNTWEQRRASLQQVGSLFVPALLVIPLLMAGAVAFDFRRQRATRQPVDPLTWAAGAVVVLLPVLLMAIYLFDLAEFELGRFLLALFGLLALLGFAKLAAEAWRQRREGLKLAVMLLFSYLLVMALALVLGPDLHLGLLTLFGLVLSYMVGCGALFTLGLGFTRQRKQVTVVGSVLGLTIMVACVFVYTNLLLRPRVFFNPFSPPSSQPRRTVVVARNPIAANSVIRVDNVFLQERTQVPSGAAVAVGDVVGGTALRDIAQGEVILMQDIRVITGSLLSGQGRAWGATPVTAAPTWTPTPTPAPTPQGQLPAAEEEPPAPEPPRLRLWFPETLYWNPEAVTDEKGHLTLPVELADSITTWRLSALASTQDGRMASATAPIRVFQDFFVDLDLPIALTQHDEMAIPVAVYNYLPEAQTVRLELAQEPWFELQGPARQEIAIGPRDVDAVYFRIKALDHGQHRLTVTAWGSESNDAVSRDIRVEPDGKRYRDSNSDWLHDGDEQLLTIPAGAVPGASRIEVKVYPGVVSQVIEGLEGIFRMPFG